MLSSGEASSASQTSLHLMEKSSTISLETIKLLASLIMLLQSKKDGKALTEEAEKDVNRLCAEAFKKSVMEHGSETESGLLCYSAEDYTIFCDPHDPTGMPVYSVVSAESGDIVFSFQERPGKEGDYVFFETASELSDEQKISILNSFAGQLQKEQSTQTGVQKVADELDRLGVLAPSGSKASIVADYVMGDQSSLEGRKYKFSRENGGIVISDVFDSKIYQMNSDGSISVHSSSGLPEHKKNFDQMFSEFQKETDRTTVQKLAAEQKEIGGR